MPPQPAATPPPPYGSGGATTPPGGARPAATGGVRIGNLQQRAARGERRFDVTSSGFNSGAFASPFLPSFLPTSRAQAGQAYTELLRGDAEAVRTGEPEGARVQRLAAAHGQREGAHGVRPLAVNGSLATVAARRQRDAAVNQALRTLAEGRDVLLAGYEEHSYVRALAEELRRRAAGEQVDAGASPAGPVAEDGNYRLAPLSASRRVPRSPQHPPPAPSGAPATPTETRGEPADDSPAPQAATAADPPEREGTTNPLHPLDSLRRAGSPPPRPGGGGARGEARDRSRGARASCSGGR